VVDTVEVRELRVLAFCGLLPEEEERRQPFAIDIDIDLDLSDAARSDKLAQTIDYGELVQAIDDLVHDGRWRLLERFASDVVDIALRDDRVVATQVTVRKLRPPVPQDLGSSGVTLRRVAE
jgi:dihydroneopterin aldolase